MTDDIILESLKRFFPNNKVEIFGRTIRITYFDGVHSRTEHISIELWLSCRNNEELAAQINKLAYRKMSEELIKDFLNQDTEKTTFEGRKVIPTPLVLESYEAIIIHQRRWMELRRDLEA